MALAMSDYEVERLVLDFLLDLPKEPDLKLGEDTAKAIAKALSVDPGFLLRLEAAPPIAEVPVSEEMKLACVGGPHDILPRSAHGGKQLAGDELPGKHQHKSNVEKPL